MKNSVATKLCLVASCALALTACAPGSAPLGEELGGGKGDIVVSSTGPVKYIDDAFAYWAEKAECATASGRVQLGRFDPSSDFAASMMEAVRTEDAQRGCQEGRTYSRSRDEGVAAFVRFLEQEPNLADELVSSCEPYGEDLGTLRSQMRALVESEDSIAVFSSSPPDGSSCYYYAFYILRADGTAARMVFDWAD